jgi:DnaJ-class molecular chaperone
MARHHGRTTESEADRDFWLDEDGNINCPECRGTGKAYKTCNNGTCSTCDGYRYARNGKARKYLAQVQKPIQEGGPG